MSDRDWAPLQKEHLAKALEAAAAQVRAYSIVPGSTRMGYESPSETRGLFGSLWREPSGLETYTFEFTLDKSEFAERPGTTEDHDG